MHSADHWRDGTGKELLAKAIISEGRRKIAPWSPFNCGAISTGSCLNLNWFGHVKGILHRGTESQEGRVEAADEARSS